MMFIFVQPMSLDSETERACEWLMLHVLTMHNNWKPIDEFRRLDVLKFLLIVSTNSHEWDPNGKNEVLIMALDILRLVFEK